MSKEIVNNRINYTNIYGRVASHDILLNQGVKSGDSPTFANLTLTGNAVIQGNLYVEGNTAMLNTNIVEFKDNIILINDLETGAGVTLHQSGLEIDRGTLENYRIVWNETDQRTEIGVISNLQPITIRESVPLPYGIMTWNPTTVRVESTNTINIPFTFTGTQNTTSPSTGSLTIAGGLGINNDIFMNGKIQLVGSNLINNSTIYTDHATNTLNLTSPQNINITPSQRIVIPYNIPLTFGNNNIYLSSNNITNTLNINSNGPINLTPANGNVNIPRQIAITFSTQNEKIYADANNNIVITSSKDILISPDNGNGTGSKILIPVNTPLAFSNINQNISSNTNNDLIVNANNNILLNPGVNLDVKLPTNNGIIFGGGGYQRIFANTNNDLNVFSSGDIYLTPNDGQHINIPTGIPLTFSNYSQFIKGDINGNLLFFAANESLFIPPIYASNTLNSTTATNGSIHTDGGIGVAKSIVCESNIIINSQNNSSLQIKNNIGDLFVVNSSDTGKVNVYTGDGTSTNPSLEISDTSLLNAQSLIQVKAAYDNTLGYMIGRGTVTGNSGRLFTFNIPSYSDYNFSGAIPRFSITTNNTSKELFSVETDTGNILTLGSFGLSNSINSFSASSGSLIVKGGLGVVKNIYTSGKVNITVTDSNAFQILNNHGDIMLNVDTIASILNINQNIIVNTLNDQAFSISNGTNTVCNISTLNNNLTSNLQTFLNNTTDSTDTSSGSVIIKGGVGIKSNLNVGGTSNFSQNINMLNNKINNLSNPTSAQDAATKAYVDLVKQGLFVKDSVMCATVQPHTLASDFTPGLTIDNYTLVLGDRILLLYQSNAVENGLYEVTNGTPSRPLDFQSGTNVSGNFVFVKQGNINASLGFICNSNSPNDIVDTNPLNFTQFTALGQVSPGAGLSKIFNQINANVDDISIEIETISNSFRIKSTAVSTGLLGGSGTPLTTNTDQTHVTKLGTISSGVWQGSNISVPYGGTGRTTLPSGNILFGNNINSIATDTNFFYDTTNIRFGLGTNAPSKNIEIKSTNNTTIFLNADSDANNSNGKPEILLSHSSNYNYYLGVSRNYNEYANNIYPNALVLSNQQTDTSSIIQIATNQQSRLTILSNGYIGINTSTPSTTLQVNGTLDVTDLVTFDSTLPSTSSTEGAVVITGGLSLSLENNSTSISNGGSLTVAGGVSIAKDLYLGGSINGADGASNTFSYLTITASDGSINKSTGSLVTFGGITIQCTINSTSITNGGSFLVGGGASIGGNLYVGKTINALTDTYLGNLYFVSSTAANYIQPPDLERTTNSFLPINFTEYNNTAANVLTITDNSIIFNKNTLLQIGGTLNLVDGYNVYYTTGNLNVIPNNANSNYNINIGTIGSFSNLNIYGNAGGQLRWQSAQSNLLVNNATIQLNKNDSSGSISLTTPNNSSISFIQASGSNMTMNLGGNSIGGQLTTVLSNDINTSTITFTPSNITNSSLVLTNNVYSTFNGPTNLSDRVEYAGNALHQSINNTSGNGLWIYIGQINNLSDLGYTEIDFNNGVTNVLGISGLKLTVSISGTTSTFAHSHYGTIPFNSTNKPICHIYDDSFNDYQLFVLLPGNSTTNINVTTQNANKFLLINEGTSTLPNGTTSNFNNSLWVSIYTTNIESTLGYTTGDLTVEGLNLKIADNLPIIGYNNRLTNSERDIGTLYQRYQVANDLGNGDIVNPGDAPFYNDSLPNQTGVVSLYQLKLSGLASSSDNFYNGMWIKIISGSNINQVRKVTSYNGAQKVITLDTPFTTQLPNTGDTVYFYNNGFIANFFDVQNNTFVLGYTASKPNNGYLNITGNANLRLKSIYSTDTTVSTNSSSGSVYLLGGISINNTNNAISATYGGTITTRGGVGIQQNLLVGNNVGIGGSGFNPQESLHIRKTTSTMRLEHNTSSFSYLDFVENGTSNRYGILFDSSINQLCLTNNNVGDSPNNSNKVLTVNNLGYIGINTTTNVVSPLALNTTNFISTNSSTGYLGLIGAASNSNDNTQAARIMLFANSQTTSISSGSLNLYGGNNAVGGNVSIFTNNDIERLSIDYNGTVNIFSTTYSDSKTTGALIVSGGVSVATSQNATSITSGGSITTPGGVSIGKDVYIGGSLYITGAFTATGSVTNPNIDSGTLVYSNCSSFNYYHNNLQVNGSLGVLTLMFTVLPSNSSQNCEVQFQLPSRTNAFIRSFEVISNCTGYSDNTNVIPLFNVLSYGVIGTANINIKFQSISSNIHYFQLQATYVIA
jgi:hypothetical protein